MALTLKLDADGDREVGTPDDIERALSRLHAPENGFALLERDDGAFIQARRTPAGFAVEHRRPSGKRYASRREDVSVGELVAIFRSWAGGTGRWHRALAWTPRDAPASRRKGSPRALLLGGLLFLAIGLFTIGSGIRERARATDEHEPDTLSTVGLGAGLVVFGVVFTAASRLQRRR